MTTIRSRTTLLVLCASLCTSAVTAQEVLLATSGPINPNLLSIDPATGSALSSVPISNEEALFGGLTRVGANLYTIDGYNDANSDRTFKIDPLGGAGAIVGNTNFNWNFRSIDLDPATGVVYAATDNALYTLDVNSGAAVLVAQISGAATQLDQLTAFAIDATGTAYFTDIGGTGLFRLNLTTGLATHLGDANIGNWLQDLAFDSTGELWGVSSSGGAYTIDVGTALPTFRFGTGGWAGITFSGCPGPTVYCTAGTTSGSCTPALTYSGTPSTSSASGFSVSCNNVDTNRTGLFFYGIAQPGFTPTQWGVGGTSYKCVANPVQRMGPMNSGGTTGCTGSFTQDWNSYMASQPSALGNPRTLGASFELQLWMRDPPSPKSTILSNAIRFVLCL